MSGITADGIEIDRDIAAAPAAVFAAWTEPAHFARWFGTAAVDVPRESLDYVAEPGRAWAARMMLPDGNAIDWAGEFLEVATAERLVLTISDRPDEGARARIVVTIEPSADGARRRFSQETPGVTPEQQQGVLAGWQGFMDELVRIAEAR